MRSRKQLAENAVHGIFLMLGLVTVGCVLLITAYVCMMRSPTILNVLPRGATAGNRL